MNIALLSAVIALLKADMDFLATPAGQAVVMDTIETVKAIRARIDRFVALAESHFGTPTKS